MGGHLSCSPNLSSVITLLSKDPVLLGAEGVRWCLFCFVETLIHIQLRQVVIMMLLLFEQYLLAVLLGSIFYHLVSRLVHVHVDYRLHVGNQTSFSVCFSSLGLWLTRSSERTTCISSSLDQSCVVVQQCKVKICTLLEHFMTISWPYGLLSLLPCSVVDLGSFRRSNWNPLCCSTHNEYNYI